MQFLWLYVFIAGVGLAGVRLPGEFRPADEPSKEDWSYFMSQTNDWRLKLWNYHKNTNEKYDSWNWAWKIGWIKSCGQSPASYCDEIFKKAETDQALVVRNEYAKVLGIRYSETKNPKSSAVLLKMLQDPLNFHSNKPLFIQETILFSLKQIGGSGLADAKKITKKHPRLANYVKRLEKPG